MATSIVNKAISIVHNFKISYPVPPLFVTYPNLIILGLSRADYIFTIKSFTKQKMIHKMGEIITSFLVFHASNKL